LDNTSFFFLLVSFGEFQQKNYVNMWGHYGSRIIRALSRALNETSGLTINILWWYKPSFYGGLCPIRFSKELGFGGSVFVL